ncbi:hypothetical protein K443DRAFT_8563 [Laccaria amethystina LaAM-08-1]|uniref:Uncharacterized protein n=1 Tax=Laccaria amethystina LaAM-08-1 TaxID=1095629 RepID=A0A0C9XNT1_9AGAR|nr:hypothetical protein K443DRAFT_8563 [Laccaria amethystina LaAM-08-1]
MSRPQPPDFVRTSSLLDWAVLSIPHAAAWIRLWHTPELRAKVDFEGQYSYSSSEKVQLDSLRPSVLVSNDGKSGYEALKVVALQRSKRASAVDTLKTGPRTPGAKRETEEDEQNSSGREQAHVRNASFATAKVCWWGVHGDRVGVDGDSAGGDADLASVDDTNTKRKFDWAHEITLRVGNEWSRAPSRGLLPSEYPPFPAPILHPSISSQLTASDRKRDLIP